MIAESLMAYCLIIGISKAWIDTQQKGVWGMPKASDGDEGRGKRRNITGTRWQGTIRRCPNGATRWFEEPSLCTEGKRGELKHLSTRRKRKQL